MEKKTRSMSEVQLNQEQLQAVEASPDRPCLVIAGPGAGKTAVIAARCRYLIEEAGVKPAEILVLTFTRAAAFEMQERFRLLTDGAHPGVNFGTFHSVFYRAVSEKYGFTAENLIKESEKQQILQEILKKHYPEAAKDSSVMEALLAGFSAIRAGREARKEENADGSREEKLERLYSMELKRRRKLDYDDILLLTRSMLREDAGVRARLKKRYQVLLIDEYQDVSPVQAEICRYLAAPENRIFAVGDDDQSIYRFRGASPDIMLRFPKDYPGSRIVKLVMNYRSSPEIVDSSLKLISRNEKRYRKTLRSGGPKEGQVLIRHFSSEKEEYRQIAEEMKAAIEAGEELSDTAVLFRTNAAISACSAGLLAAGVPFVSRDRVQDPFRHFAAETVFAVLNFMSGDRSRANFLKFMNCPVRYIRRQDLRAPYVDLGALREQYRRDESRSWMTEKIDLLSNQLSLLSRLQIPYAMVNYIRRGMGLDEHYRDYCLEHGLPDAEIMGTLDFVQDSARDFRDLGDWYRYIQRFSKELAEKPEEQQVKGRLVLSTIHQAKGLEYQRVYVADVCEQNIPHAKSGEEEEIAEERRLFYVALTRAKKDLRLYVPGSMAGRRREESRFLKEIRSDFVKEIRKGS